MGTRARGRWPAPQLAAKNVARNFRSRVSFSGIEKRQALILKICHNLQDTGAAAEVPGIISSWCPARTLANVGNRTEHGEDKDLSGSRMIERCVHLRPSAQPQKPGSQVGWLHPRTRADLIEVAIVFEKESMGFAVVADRSG